MTSLYAVEISPLLGILYIALGLVFCFAGYGVCKAFVRVYGLLLGFFIGLFAGALAKSETLMIAGAIAGGLLGSILIPIFYFIGLFITGGLTGALLLALPVAALDLGSPAPELGAILAGFVLGGMIGVRYEKAIMVVLTSIFGVAVAGLGLNSLGIAWLELGPRDAAFRWSAAAIVVRAALLAAGLASQYAIVRKLDKRRPITQYW